MPQVRVVEELIGLHIDRWLSFAFGTHVPLGVHQAPVVRAWKWQKIINMSRINSLSVFWGGKWVFKFGVDLDSVDWRKRIEINAQADQEIPASNLVKFFGWEGPGVQYNECSIRAQLQREDVFLLPKGLFQSINTRTMRICMSEVNDICCRWQMDVFFGNIALHYPLSKG